ncbi:MAG: thiamine pyrophosphate-binding protein [Planctomycetota bacterium]|nr:MAG: thiamine pyrophosphate-binding protein [Planctomycetota bacterium]
MGDYLVHFLENLGVEYVFGIPGGTIEPLYNAMARSARRNGLRPVLARHESGAAFMAAGYARETGKLGVCCSTSGPGATNLLTGVASAFVDHTPLLVLTAETPLPDLGRSAFQESSRTGVDMISMFQSCTHYASRVSHPRQLPAKLFAATLRAMRLRRGPVHLSLPSDVLSSAGKGLQLPAGIQSLQWVSEAVDDRDVEFILKCLGRARKVVLVIGKDCRGCSETLFRFAELCGAQVVATPEGKTWALHNHPRFHGIFGFGGHESAHRTLLSEGADLVICAGTAFHEFDGLGKAGGHSGQTLIHVDEISDHLCFSPGADFHVYGSIRRLFHLLTTRLSMQSVASRKESSAPTASVDLPIKESSGRIYPPWLIQELVRELPAKTRFVADTGNSFAWSTHFLKPERTGNYRVEMGFGSMGWGMGTAIGMAMGDRSTPVVCLHGDGSMLMNGQELTVAVSERLPLITVVLNDGSLGMVRHGQKLAGAEEVCCDLPAVDFAMLARSLGAEAFTIRTAKELKELDWPSLCRSSLPVLLDVHVDAEACPPMKQRSATLNFQKTA